MIGQRNMLCGLHVHVELPDPDQRVDIMYRMLPYLPLFVALGTSSPFWQSRVTGLKGYRLAAYDELPRTGVPELFRTAEIRILVEALVRAGVIGMRATSGGRSGLRSSIRRWSCARPIPAPALPTRWRSRASTAASRATSSASRDKRRTHRRRPRRGSREQVAGAALRRRRHLRRSGRGALTVAGWLDRVISDITDDATTLGCLAEVQHCYAIVDAGTSADAQLRSTTRRRRETTITAKRCAPSSTGSRRRP